MDRNPVTDRNDAEFAEQRLRELSNDETALVGGGILYVPRPWPPIFGHCPLPNGYMLGPFCTN
jgi:hypothetical protein